jgi:uncharacterized protein (TIGR00296 family)
MTEILTNEEEKELLRIARNAMERAARKEMIGKPKNYPTAFNNNYGVLCVMRKGRELRGQTVVGFPASLFSLLDAALSAVTTLTSECNLLTHELNDIKIELSLLTEPELMRFSKNDEIPGLVNIGDGLLLRYGIYEAFLPPQAWYELREKEKFLDALCEKAGLEKSAWREADLELYNFHAQVLKED